MAKIGEALARRLRAAGAEEELRVLVRLRGEPDRNALMQRGMRVEEVLPEGRAVTGLATVALVLELAAEDDVEEIESDAFDPRAQS